MELYLKEYIGDCYEITETSEKIYIGNDFPDEYTESRYTKSLRGSIAKAKANAAQVIGKMIVVATNRRWVENKDEKHNININNNTTIFFIKNTPLFFTYLQFHAYKYYTKKLK